MGSAFHTIGHPAPVATGWESHLSSTMQHSAPGVWVCGRLTWNHRRCRWSASLKGVVERLSKPAAAPTVVADRLVRPVALAPELISGREDHGPWHGAGRSPDDCSLRGAEARGRRGALSSALSDAALQGTRSQRDQQYGLASGTLAGDELLPTVHVERGTGDRRVGHEVDHGFRYVGRADDTSDGQGFLQPQQARSQFVAEQPGR